MTQPGEEKPLGFFPTSPGAPASRPAPPTIQAPTRLKLSLGFEARARVGVAPWGVARRLRRRLPEGRPPRPGKADPAPPRRLGHALWRRLGPQSVQEAPALGGPLHCQLEAGGARAPSQGGSASPRAPGRPHTCPGVTSARAPGACVSCRSKSCCAGVLRPPPVRGPRRRREEGPGAQRGIRNVEAKGIFGAVRSSACPAPAVSSALRCSISGWARWRCPGARRPRGAHRLDPGGPAVGRRPQFHGWFGAQ